jgi:nitrite reductase (NO-forming)
MLNSINFGINMVLNRLFYMLPILLLSCSGSSETDSYDQLPVNSEFEAGKEVYARSCVACHMKDGNGLEGTFPPLAKSDYMLAEPKRALKQVIYGSDETMVVNGNEYTSIMPPQEVSDQEAIDVVNYILNAWGNDGGTVNQEDLNEVKKENS